MHLSTAEGRLHHVVGQRNAHRVNFKERSDRPAGTYVHRLTDIHFRRPHCPEVTRITRVTQTQPAKATRLPNTNHQRVSQQVPYCREVPGYPLLTTGLSAAVYPSRMHIANFNREVQDSSNLLYFAPRSYPFSAFFPPRSTESGMFSVLRAQNPVESDHPITTKTTWQHPHRLRDTKQSVFPHFPTPKTTSATSHRLRDS